MWIFDVTSIILLAVLLFWTAYNGAIIFVGVRHQRKHRAIVQQTAEGELPKFSLIVPTKDEELVISKCLDGLVSMDYPKEKLEIVMVDGDSSDSTKNICSKYLQKYPQIFKFISEGTSKGKPAALNLALPYTTGEIVGVFDADSLAQPDVLRKVAAYFNDKKIVAVQGRTSSSNERSNALTRVIATEEKAWFQALLSGREKLQLFIPLTGSCQFVKRDVLVQMGGWDETSLTEDVELALRLVEKNYGIKYAFDVCSKQETPVALKPLIRQRTRWYRGYMETAIKYGRLLNTLNKRTVDAEISMAGPFMMVVSLLSYINWFIVALLFFQSNPVINFTGLVIALTAVSLVSIGIGLTASEKPIKIRNIVWIPFIYVYWLLQMVIAGWAFFKLLFRRKRVWTKTIKSGPYAQNYDANKPFPTQKNQSIS